MTRELSGNPSTEKVNPVPAKLGLGEKWLTVANNHLGAWAGPWGVSFAMNLTPDKETGLGSWTPEMFMNALKTGKHQGTGRPILPPMPWVWYRSMTDDDLKAMFAYLRTPHDGGDRTLPVLCVANFSGSAQPAELNLAPGKPQTVVLHGRVSRTDAPWIAVVIRDDDFSQRRELIGTI